MTNITTAIMPAKVSKIFIMLNISPDKVELPAKPVLGKGLVFGRQIPLEKTKFGSLLQLPDPEFPGPGLKLAIVVQTPWLQVKLAVPQSVTSAFCSAALLLAGLQVAAPGVWQVLLLAQVKPWPQVDCCPGFEHAEPFTPGVPGGLLQSPDESQ